MTQFDPSRRKFIISSTAGVSGLMIAQSALGGAVVNLLDPGSPLVLPENFTPCVWFTMQSSGEANIHIFKQELGQHVGTAFAQIVAEELDLDWSKVNIDYPEMDSVQVQKTGQQLTGGSMSVLTNFTELAQSAAVARQFLVEAGAEILGSAPTDCITQSGYVIDPIYEERISYSEILSQTTISHTIQPEELAEATLKKREDYKIIGQSLPALDIEEKVNGKAKYSIDAYVPNMVYGKMSLAPTRLGSKILSVNDVAAREEIPGYIRTLSLSASGMPGMGRTDVALVIAESFPAAMRAAQLIDVQWDVPASQRISSEALFADAKALPDRAEGVKFLSVGNVEAALKDASEILEAEYQTSMIEHAALEPRNALVQNIDGVYHIYSGHHMGSALIEIIAGELGVGVQQVVFHPNLVGGSFGDKIYGDQVTVAAQACQVVGRPVKVMLTREDQFNFGHPKTISHQRLKAAIKDDQSLAIQKRIQAIKHDLVAAPGSPGKMPNFQYDDIDSKRPKMGFMDNARGAVAGSDHWYDIEHTEVQYFYQTLMTDLVPVGHVRSVGNFYNVFDVESFIDELAHRLKVDPLDLRLSLLKSRGRNGGAPARADESSDSLLMGAGQVTVGGGQRLANVLKIATGQANYGSPLLKKNRAQGISIAAAENRMNPTYAACVADIEWSKTGNISVKKLTVCADVGLAINPDGIRSQIEGSLLWGMSSTFYEEAVLEDGRLKETNFDAYKWQRNTELPELDIHIVENGVHPSGAGENTLSLVAPAVCNAIHRLTGKRLRSLPLKHHLPIV
jgi:isoquinoline 1-oxidoreductase beta subunit